MSVLEGEERTLRYLEALKKVQRNPGRGTPVETLEMWEDMLAGKVTFEDLQEVVDEALDLRQRAEKQLESLDYKKHSDN